MECARLRDELSAAIQGRDSIKSEYDTYKKRVHSVLAEQDSHYNRSIELERLLHVSNAASDAKSKELHLALARLSEMEAIAAQVVCIVARCPRVFMMFCRKQMLFILYVSNFQTL
jgi:hypothetical protein